MVWLELYASVITAYRTVLLRRCFSSGKDTPYAFDGGDASQSVSEIIG